MTGNISGEQRIAISRISGLVLANALIFQEVLSQNNSKVANLQHVLRKNNLQHELCEHWQSIIDHIDYYPIFHIAVEILSNISASKDFSNALEELAKTAQKIVGMRAALRHDLMGRIYHRLLLEKKYLGTYYTSIPSAALLLKITLRAGGWGTDWRKIEEVRNLKIADLACGTGTLLMAAADSITDNYVSATAAYAEKIETGALQNALTEEVLYGYDVLPSAIHLTASTLALRAPEVKFEKMNLYYLPLGGSTGQLGSLEYLFGRGVGMYTDLFGTQVTAKQIKGKQIEEKPIAFIPELDLCVMNPPFTRSVGGNLLFGSLPQKEREKAQKRLKEIVRTKNAPANITAGLGSVFVAVADPHIRVGGRLSLVLPKAILSGVAWQKTRALITKNYDLEYLIVSHDPERWNFSENTSLSEVLIVAKKRGQEEPGGSQRVKIVNLWRNPTTAFEAQATAEVILTGKTVGIEKGQGAGEIFIGSTKAGEILTMGWPELRKENQWMLPCAFAQSDLARTAYALKNGVLWVPGMRQTTNINLIPMGDLAYLGPDRRDIHDGFTVGKTVTSYPAYWGHKAEAMYTISQTPNKYLVPLANPQKGRHLRMAGDLWPRAGRFLMAERLRLNTQRATALLCDEKVLSNVWWPVTFLDSGMAESWEKIAVLWQNSTLGILLLLAMREETEGAWVDFKKPILEGLPIIDVRILTTSQIKILTDLYTNVSEKTLLPFPQMNIDETRGAIDAGFANALGLPDFSMIRDLLSNEPILSLRRL